MPPRGAGPGDPGTTDNRRGLRLSTRSRAHGSPPIRADRCQEDRLAARDGNRLQHLEAGALQVGGSCGPFTQLEGSHTEPVPFRNVVPGYVPVPLQSGQQAMNGGNRQVKRFGSLGHGPVGVIGREQSKNGERPGRGLSDLNRWCRLRGGTGRPLRGCGGQ